MDLHTLLPSIKSKAPSKVKSEAVVIFIALFSTIFQNVAELLGTIFNVFSGLLVELTPYRTKSLPGSA